MARLESKVRRGRPLSLAEKTELGNEKVRLADKLARQRDPLRRAERDQKARLGRELTRDELREAHEASPQLRDAKTHSDATLAQWKRTKAISDAEAARTSPGSAVCVPNASTRSAGTPAP